MSQLKKQSFILALVVLIAGSIQWGMSVYKNNQTPEKVGLKFLENLSNKEELLNKLTKSDASVLRDNALDLIPIKNIPPFVYRGGTALSETTFKADFSNGENDIVSLNMTKESGWKVYLNLERNKKIKDLFAELKEAEVEANETVLLRIYKDINQVLPTEEYSEKIKRLEAYILEKEEKESYKQKISIEGFSLKGSFISGFILNKGNRSISKVTGNFIVGGRDGQILWEESIVLFELIPGSFVFGQPIKSGFQKKFGLNLVNKTIPKDAVINFEVTAVEF